MIKVIAKFFSILDLDQKKKLIFLLLLSFVAAILEMLGLSLFIPIITSLNNFDFHYNIFTNSSLVNFFHSFVIFFNNKIFLFLIFLGVFFLIKTIILIYFSGVSSKFSSNLHQKVASRIFKNYLYQDYNFYISRSSSQLIQNINSEITILVTRFFASFIILINEILIFLLISILLLLVSSTTFFLVLFFFIFSFILFIYSTRRLLRLWGFQRQKHEINSIKYVQEGIRNIKDLKVYGVEEKFFDYFDFEIKQFSKIDKSINLLSSVPKYYIEFISIILFISIYWLLSFFDISNQRIVIILSFFAVAAIKLMPSINRILNALVQIKYSTATIDVIYKEINLKNNYKNNKSTGSKKEIFIKNNLLIKNLHFKHEGSNHFLFKNINLKIPFKNIIGVIGDSGSGKTTFIDLILGLIKPNKGSILLNNIDILSDLKYWRDNISYVQQFSYFTQDSIKRNIAIRSKENFIDVNKVNYCLQQVGLSKFVNNLPKKINSKLSELANNLSGGQKQRLSIARALYSDTNILILDEATNSLDEKSEIKLIKNIIALYEDKTVFIITHKKSLLQYCDLVLKVENNNIKKYKYY
jgi:ABC-type bacteriocin/lantibiotic exporter with double-glycine peptidase domain